MCSPGNISCANFSALTRTFQILPDNRFHEREIALLGRDDSFPFPLIGIGRVILGEEVIPATEQRVLWRGPNDLRVDRMLLTVIADVELDRCGAVVVEHAIHAASTLTISET